MERKINEPFKDQRGKMVKAVLSNPTCWGCCYKYSDCWRHGKVLGECICIERSDDQDVIFKEETK